MQYRNNSNSHIIFATACTLHFYYSASFKYYFPRWVSNVRKDTHRRSLCQDRLKLRLFRFLAACDRTTVRRTTILYNCIKALRNYSVWYNFYQCAFKKSREIVGKYLRIMIYVHQIGRPAMHWKRFKTRGSLRASSNIIYFGWRSV